MFDVYSINNKTEYIVAEMLESMQFPDEINEEFTCIACNKIHRITIKVDYVEIGVFVKPPPVEVKQYTFTYQCPIKGTTHPYRVNIPTSKAYRFDNARVTETVLVKEKKRRGGSRKK